MPKKKKRKLRRERSRGTVEFLVLFIIVAFGIFVSGFLRKDKSPQSSIQQTDNGTAVTCCDTGNGDDCKVKTGAGETLTYKGVEYGLIKSAITQSEQGAWLRDSGEKFNGNPIILNISQLARDQCGKQKDDQVVGGTGCVAIPDDELIYVCKQECTGSQTGFIYGNSSTVYDVYFRLSDLPTPGIPDVIKNCNPTKSNAVTSKKTSVQHKYKFTYPTETAGNNLQLKKFDVTEEFPPSTSGWLSPYCKPAIYLYPTTEQSVSVKVNPLGPLTYTDPLYPKSGWEVKASPNGAIFYQNKNYDYLYYETSIPDDKIEKPKEGFVVDKNQMPITLKNTLGLLGLTKKESDEFISYWSKVLPDSPYYFIGVVSTKNLDSIAPLNIAPKPDTTIRVTLYFEALDKKIEVTPPYLAPVDRAGFTVVEWGGIFKKDKNHPFSCLM